MALLAGELSWEFVEGTAPDYYDDAAVLHCGSLDFTLPLRGDLWQSYSKFGELWTWQNVTDEYFVASGTTTPPTAGTYNKNGSYFGGYPVFYNSVTGTYFSAGTVWEPDYWIVADTSPTTGSAATSYWWKDGETYPLYISSGFGGTFVPGNGSSVGTLTGSTYYAHTLPGGGYGPAWTLRIAVRQRADNYWSTVTHVVDDSSTQIITWREGVAGEIVLSEDDTLLLCQGARGTTSDQWFEMTPDP
jgi:hypothetical protein